jgi:thiosulfate dehydrogenase
MILKTTKTAAAITVAALFSVGLAQARPPVTPNEAAGQMQQLIDEVNEGYKLWHGGLKSTNGLACGNCHPDGAAVGPQTFPKYQLDMGKVVPLRDMINWCIQIPLQGAAISSDSREMLALEAYAFYMSRGKPITPGDNSAQQTPVKVNSGVGYPGLNGREPLLSGQPLYNPKNPMPAYPLNK